MWEKLVYIPHSEAIAAYAKYFGKSYGTNGMFVYTFVGDIRIVSRKPCNVAHWSD